MTPSHSDAVDPEERAAWLNALASALSGESVAAHVTDDGRLFVQHGTAKQHVTAAPDNRTGTWSWWFGTEYIAAVTEPRKAVTRILRRLALDEFSMPDPVDIKCVSCGNTFTCDRKSQAAKNKQCPDCAVPEARSL